MSEERAYEKLQSAFEALGGTLTHEKADRPQGGCWIAYLSGHTPEIPSTQSTRFPLLDACYKLLPGVAASRSWEDHSDEINPVGLADLLLRLAGAPALHDLRSGSPASADLKALEQALEERVARAAAAYRKTVGRGYAPWLEAGSEEGALEACRQVLATKDHVPRLTVYWENGLLAHSVEAIATEEEFQPLFTFAERATAQVRLREFGFDAPGR